MGNPSFFFSCSIFKLYDGITKLKEKGHRKKWYLRQRQRNGREVKNRVFTCFKACERVLKRFEPHWRVNLERGAWKVEDKIEGNGM